MRKLILISALLLVSASAQASERILAAADAPPPATSTDSAQPLPPAGKSDTNDRNDSAKPQADETAAQVRAAKLREARRYQGDEAKARRIAARYGISW